jgi:hypothetical protein
MTALPTSTALATVQPAFTDAERLAPAGYRGPDPQGLHPRPAPVHRLVPVPLSVIVLGAASRHRDVRP